MDAERTASDVFRLLSDETRLDVLRTVARAQRDARRAEAATLSFSEVYERVDVDNTAKLSYHLGELTGTFLRKGTDGYGFTHAGEQMVRFVLAENYRSPDDFGALETDGCCLYCGGESLRATLEDQHFRIQCRACERPVFSYRVRPAQVRSRSGSELVESVVWEQAGDFIKMRQGVCPDCAGRIETEVVAVEGEPVPDGMPVSFVASSECRECMRCLGLPMTYAAAYHPESVAFHWEDGLDVLGTGVWELHRFLHDGRWDCERIDEGDPSYRVKLRRDDASLRLYLDGSAAVTRTERVRHRDQRGRRT